MDQKGDGSFFLLLGENSGIHQEAKQTTRYGSPERAGPQAPSANKDLTLRPVPRGSGAKSRKTCVFKLIFTDSWFTLRPLPR